MPLRAPSVGLYVAASAVLLVLLGLLLALRLDGTGASAWMLDVALVLNVVLLPLPVLGARTLRRRADIARELQAATDAKTRFLTQISHEIRTPMNAIMGMTQLTLHTPLSPEQRDLLTKADAASRTLLGLVNDVLDVSKIEAGHMQIESAPLRLEDVVGQAIELVRSMHVNSDVELICDWGDASLLGPRGSLRGDALRLQQVLVNLLSNALKFTSAGEVRLRLAARPTDAHGLVPLQFIVQDTGIGMDAAQLAGLFREFAQGDVSITRRFGGTGLGLVITRRLVELMGGRLDVQSTPGRGSSFEIQLALPLDPGGPPLPAPRPERLLLAQQHAEGRKATVAMLQALGLGDGLVATADLAATRAALAEARQAGAPIDLLLLDWRLPGDDASLTSLDLLAGLRRDHPALRIALTCTAGMEETAAQVRAFGARELCPKPLLPADVRRLLLGAPASRAEAVDTQSLAGLRILVVEDHPINQEIAQRLLAGRGAHVELAGNGQEGLALLRERGPTAFDLVLMDLQMPVLDGLSATRQLRELPGFGGLPVLAMTAHALAEERAQCLAAGMQGHIAKPLDVARLVRELQRYRPGAAASVAPPPAADGSVPRSTAVLDLHRGLHQFDGQQALYRRTLQGFVDQYAPGVGSWQQWMSSGDWAELRRAAHTLQGLAAMLGAHPLHTQALGLERSALASDAATAGQRLPLVDAALAQLLQEITATLDRPWHTETDTPVSGPGDLTELRRLLEHDDSRALDWWQHHGSQAGLDGDTARRLGDALAVMDFGAALALLNAHTGGAGSAT